LWKVGDVVGVVTGIEDGPDAVGVGWPWSELEEQPARRAATAATAKIGELRMPPIYATLAIVLERTICRECCRA
jgi:hypothetical protein